MNVKKMLIILFIFPTLILLANPIVIGFCEIYTCNGCLYPGDNIVYNLCYNRPYPGSGNNFDVELVCILDPKHEFVSADNNGVYDVQNHKVTWNILNNPPSIDFFVVDLVCHIPANTSPNTLFELIATVDDSDIPFVYLADPGNNYTQVCSSWNISDSNTRWVQHPDLIGWNFDTMSSTSLADDWECIETGLVQGIHFWGSWKDDQIPNFGDYSFRLSIHENFPANPSDPDDFEKPGLEKWSYNFMPTSSNILTEPIQGQGWYDPLNDLLISPFFPNNHNQWFQYSVNLPQNAWFLQIGVLANPVKYWLVITATCNNGNLWGWKSALFCNNNNALWKNTTRNNWNYLTHTALTPMALSFVLTGSPSSLPVELSSFTGAFNSALCSSMLSWTTQSESENMGWNVYRSTSTSFNESIQLNASIISGAGTTSEPTNYEFQDQNDMEFNTEYRYWLEYLSFDGESQQLGPIVISTLSEEEQPDTPELVTAIGLKQNYPNPFNPDTQISFIMEKTGECELTIYDTKGRIVKDLFKGNIEAEQNYTFTWNGRNNNGKSVASGIYLYKIKSGNYIETKKMILMK